MSRTLFLLTKYYPFGTMEKYINHELPFISAKFEKVILVPTEYFGEGGVELITSPLPSNVEVYLLNEEVKKQKPSAWKVLPEAMYIWLYEFIHNPNRKFLLRHFSKNKNVLLYQLLCSNVFSEFIKEERFKKSELSFYSYWYHHSTLLLAILKRRKSINYFISRAHSIDLYNEDWPLAGDKHKPLPFGYFKMKYIDHVAAISDHGKRHLIKKYPGFDKKITRSYLGVNDHGEGPVSNGEPFLIVTCSNFNLNKRLDMIPAILGRLNFQVKWIHFGTGGDGENEVMEKIKNLSSNATVELKGYVANNEIAEFYKKMPVNLFLNLSKLEGLPVSVMEAISFGIPVIATDVFGTPELISKGNGWLITVNTSPEEIAKYISEMHDNSQLQQKMRSASREVFLENFNSKKNYLKFIDDLLLPSPNKF